MDDVEITPIVDTNTQDIWDVISDKKDTSVIDVEVTEDRQVDKPSEVMISTQPSQDVEETKHTFIANVSEHDLASLEPGQWLNDSIINTYLE